MLNKNDPLIGAVQQIMQKSDAERAAVKAVNEKFGVQDRKALPWQKQSEWDAAYKKVLSEGNQTLNEETLEEGTVQKRKNDFRDSKYRYSNNAPHMGGPGKFTEGTYMTGPGSYDDKDETKVSNGLARKMTKKYIYS